MVFDLFMASGMNVVDFFHFRYLKVQVFYTSHWASLHSQLRERNIKRANPTVLVAYLPGMHCVLSLMYSGSNWLDKGRVTLIHSEEHLWQNKKNKYFTDLFLRDYFFFPFCQLDQPSTSYLNISTRLCTLKIAGKNRHWKVLRKPSHTE